MLFKESMSTSNSYEQNPSQNRVSPCVLILDREQMTTLQELASAESKLDGAQTSSAPTAPMLQTQVPMNT